MAALAALCGILIVAVALVTTRRAPTDAQFGIEVTSFVGGLVLCFLAVVLARLAALNKRLDAVLRRDGPGALPSAQQVTGRDDGIEGE